jgi:hypothetical protein
MASNNSGADTVTYTGVITVFGLPSNSIQQHTDTLSVPPGMTYYQWYFNDTLLFGDTLNYVVATHEGDYNIIYIDSNGCPGFDTLYNVSLDVAALNNSMDNIRLWPNPVKNQLNISFAGEIENIQLIDLSGRIIFEADKFRQHVIDVSELNGGVYFVKIDNGQKNSMKKFIIVR